MTAATLNPSLHDQISLRFTRKRRLAFAIPLIILAYLTYAFFAFDLPGLAARARMDNAVILLSDFWSHKTHVTRDNRTDEVVVAIEGESKGTYPEGMLPDWVQIAGLYDVLVRANPSPVVALNRAAAVAMRDGPAAGLALVDGILAAGDLHDYHLAHSARADLCRRLGLGLIVVADGRAEVLEDPVSYRPRRDGRRAGRLLREHQRRVGDPNLGGSTRRPIMTAYRQAALALAEKLREGPARPRDLRGIAPDAATILYRNVYGWFVRPATGLYALAPEGEAALAAWLAEAALTG